MKTELTIEQLKAMQSGNVFATGTIQNHPDGIFMTNSDIGRNLIWVAKRGDGYHDWAIYLHWEDSGIDFTIAHGDKCPTKYVRKLVPCNDEAFGIYRR